MSYYEAAIPPRVKWKIDRLQHCSGICCGEQRKPNVKLKLSIPPSAMAMSYCHWLKDDPDHKWQKWVEQKKSKGIRGFFHSCLIFSSCCSIFHSVIWESLSSFTNITLKRWWGLTNSYTHVRVPVCLTTINSENDTKAEWMPVDVTSYLQCINIHKGKNSDHKLGFRDGMKSLFMQEGLREELLILKIERSQLEVAQ